MAVSRVRVRTLGEFVFCPRAGLLSHASADEEDEPTDERMNLNFLPEYSLTLIEEQLAVQLRRLTHWAAWAAGGLFLVVVAVWNELPPVVPLALAVPTILCVWKSLHALSAVVTLGDRRREALSATPTEPPADLTDDTPVRWWELLKAGFESVPYLEPLFDGELALAGKPWRALKKGSLRIPVVRLPADNYHAGRYWVYEQHRVRLAAYALLLAACEGGQTPYAVVLFGGSYEGVAVPIISATTVIAKLDELRRGLDLEKMGIPTPLADQPERLLRLSARAAPRRDRRGPERRVARAKVARRHRAGRAGVPQRLRGQVWVDAAARRRGPETTHPAGLTARPHGGGFPPLTRRASAADAVEQSQKCPSERPEPRPRSKFLGECVHGRQTRGPVVEPRVRVERETAGEESVEGGDGGPGNSVAVGHHGRRRPVFVGEGVPQFRQAGPAADAVEGNSQGEQFVAEDAERKIVRPEIDRGRFPGIVRGRRTGPKCRRRIPAASSVRPATPNRNRSG